MYVRSETTLINLDQIAVATMDAGTLSVRFAIPVPVYGDATTGSPPSVTLGHYQQQFEGAEARELWEQIEDVVAIA